MERMVFQHAGEHLLTAPEQFNNTKSNASNNTAYDSGTMGLRMVVFGGGDVATPSLSSSEWNGQGRAWTEVMCKKLGCDTYLSFVPEADSTGGAVISNSLLDAAYERVSAYTVGSKNDDKTAKIDYSWVTEQYPKPYQHDLAAQVDSFLSSSRQQRASTESLWVFNVGYWDVWYLAALPRKLATEVLDLGARDLFFQIERLYQAAQDPTSAAFSRPYDQTARAPFRIFLTRVFDISLTPGFASERPNPPKPHLSSTQLRNAAFLTKYWDALLEMLVDHWLATPDPESWSIADKVDIKVLEALVGKRSLADQDPGQEEEAGKDHDRWSGKISLPRREVSSYGISHYVRELMMDRQLRNADLFDHNGLGARPSEDGFLDISMPCALNIADNAVIGDEEAAAAGPLSKTVVCQEPDNYLFYTGFTVGPRAIHEIGVRAARRFLDQVEINSRWREKARMHKDGGREHAEPSTM
ncbi:hypothetical protein O1611_g2243 [Lasiodiplodia mahajangana]|uniref:Uncharacterized protein n=1 Tax=Lasiodiplodia mahajangana TaxID=1108764 RepID=A0ACC2JV78_9PEZI|nr:hypothetical protein O1611_g2243 [Lasiodiplodia mahajangana]